MGLHCETCRCVPPPKGRYEFIVDGERYDTNEEYVSLDFILAHAPYAHGRTVIWMRDGGEEEEVTKPLASGRLNCTRQFSTVNTPRFATIPPATMGIVGISSDSWESY